MAGLRITGGALGSRRLKVPPGLAVRPTADRVKEALFAMLGERVAGVRAADLFAGSGALGLEALSRGAASCLWVENDPRAAAVIRENLTSLGVGEAGRLWRGDATRPEPLLALGPFDLVLADPPYRRGLVQGVVDMCAAGFLAPGGVLALEHDPAERPAAREGLVPWKQRAYGQTEVSLFLKPATPRGPTK